MNEITGPNGVSGKGDINVARAGRGSASRAGAAAGRQLERAKDDASLSVEGRSLSQLSELPAVRTELVNRLSAEVNDPNYAIDEKLEAALGKLFGDVFNDS